MSRYSSIIRLPKLFLSSTFLLLAVCSFQQAVNIDSLKKLVGRNSSNRGTILQACIQLSGNLDVHNFNENLLHGYKGLDIASDLKDSTSIGIILSNIGKAHYFNANYDSASVYYYKAVSVLSAPDKKVHLADAYNNLAKMYRKLRELPRAHEFYRKALQLYSALNDKNGIATIYNEWGVVYEYEKDFKQAIRNYNMSLEMRRQMKDSVGMAYSLNFIGGAYALMGKFTESLEYNQGALAIRRALKDSFAMALSYSDLGIVHRMKGDRITAASMLTSSNEIARKIKYPDLILNNLKELATLHAEDQDYATAYTYQQEYGMMKDSIYQSETRKQVEEMAAKYKNAEQEKQIQEQVFQITKRNYWIIGISLLTLLLCLLGLSAYKRYKLKREAEWQMALTKERTLSAQLLVEAEEKERRRIAAELHDGVGQTLSAASLNLSAFRNIFTSTKEQQNQLYDKIQQLVDDSCREVRNVSHQLMPQNLQNKNLATAVRELISRIDKKVLTISLHDEGFYNAGSNQVESLLYRVIQEVVNNTLKHSNATRLDITIVKTDEVIDIMTEDDGKGFMVKEAFQKNGMGLQNMQSRISYLQGKIEWDSRPGKGTLVSINVPIKQNE